MHIKLLCSLAVIAVACNSDASVGEDPDISNPSVDALVLAADIFPDDVRDLDLLFVMDNSASMVNEQESIAAWAQDSLFGLLTTDNAGGLMNLHVAVVSTDLGAGASDYISGCEGTGDNGVFNTEPADDACSPPDGSFIIDVGTDTGERTRNYSGTLAETFSCIARMAPTGCGFEEPLEAMKLALDGSNSENDGFLRDDALLAVVIVSDEDDCSAFDPELFNPDNADLGPLASFRCFDYGVVCDEDNREPGTKTNCRSREDSEYVSPIEGYAEFLKGLKADPSKVVVAVIAGTPNPVTVSPSDDNGNPQLDWSCESAGGQAAPAIRLTELLTHFPARSRLGSICSDNMGGPLGEAALRISDAATGSPCLYGNLKDLDGAAAGVQPNCRVSTVPDGDAVILPACDGSAPGDCYTIAEDVATCGHTSTHLAVTMTRSGDSIERTMVECEMQ